MKILHCCLAAFYIDNYGYQENILPRMHKLQGHEVMILASTETYVDNLNLGYVEPKEYRNEDDIEVHRIPYVNWLPHKVATKLRYYIGVYGELCKFKPDCIFLHDIQFMGVSDIVKYLKKNSNVKVYVDGHADFGNSAKNFISKYILHKIFYKYCVQLIEPYVIKFYGTLPARVKFFTDFYGTPQSKTELLVMGADDNCVQLAKKTNQRELLRRKFKVADDEILLVTGGKFDIKKREVLNVMRAVTYLKEETKIKMIIFGSVTEENGFKKEFNSLCDGDIIQYVGWIKSSESYNYFEAADIVIFPTAHSVLWEQAVGQGKPCIFRYIEGMTHVDVGGNCVFLKERTEIAIKKAIKETIDNYDSMCKVAEERGMNVFSFDKIAKRAIE